VSSIADVALSLSRVLRNDTGIGVIRYADAGYDVAKDKLRNNDFDFRERLR
jgi:urocanate hydratase